MYRSAGSVTAGGWTVYNEGGSHDDVEWEIMRATFAYYARNTSLPPETLGKQSNCVVVTAVITL